MRAAVRPSPRLAAARSRTAFWLLRWTASAAAPAPELGTAVVAPLLERRVGRAWAGHAAFAVTVGYAAGAWLGPFVS